MYHERQQITNIIFDRIEYCIKIVDKNKIKDNDKKYLHRIKKIRNR